MKGKALRRALASQAAVRINSEIPLIIDKTELITPGMAQEMLKHNDHNRPVNWKKVEEFADIMRNGKWKFHSQGIILDSKGNILTGQTRLWAIVYSDTSVYMRVSTGNPTESAEVLDRGRPQSSRDLATRKTERKHSPTENSIARAICVLRGTKPTVDAVASVLVDRSDVIAAVLRETARDKKNKSVLMVLAAICESSPPEDACRLAKRTAKLSGQLDEALRPHSAEELWGKGTAFSMALEQARRCLD